MTTTLETADPWAAAVRALRTAGPRSLALPRLPTDVDLPLRRDDVVVVGTLTSGAPAHGVVAHLLPGLTTTLVATSRLAVVGGDEGFVVTDEADVVAGVHAHVSGLSGTTLVTPELLDVDEAGEAAEPEPTGRLLVVDGEVAPDPRPRRGPLPTYVVQRARTADARLGDLVVQRTQRGDGHVLLHPPALVVGDGLLRRRLDRRAHTLAVATESFRVLGLLADFGEREVRAAREQRAFLDLWSLEA